MTSENPVTGCLNVFHDEVDCEAAGLDLQDFCVVCRQAGGVFTLAEMEAMLAASPRRVCQNTLAWALSAKPRRVAQVPDRPASVGNRARRRASRRRGKMNP